MPSAWNGYKIHYRYRQTVYHIAFSRLPADSAATSQLFLDGQEIPGPTFPLHDDHREHGVEFKFR
jgi:cyclic beta-1,2-glucan synthetase